ncbi:hypothetical protein BV898_16872 [Hypsibius exemplaris]|uniref:MARVEL domain-containing protein n=1 Tax=Hypsibius exemplaris TaxID=2072580 RepID=A0A9X6RLW8_HYPEX|nr:hypothetical protein BV898_16872 [Hypsibius exemplaris]
MLQLPNDKPYTFAITESVVPLRHRRGSFGLAIIQVVFGAIILIVELVALGQLYVTITGLIGIGMSIFFIITGCVGITAALPALTFSKWKPRVLAHMIMAIISIIFCLAMVALTLARSIKPPGRGPWGPGPPSAGRMIAAFILYPLEFIFFTITAAFACSNTCGENSVNSTTYLVCQNPATVTNGITVSNGTTVTNGTGVNGPTFQPAGAPMMYLAPIVQPQDRVVFQPLPTAWPPVSTGNS